MTISRSVLPCLFFLVASLTVFAQEEIPVGLEITLQRSPCFGWCPSYSVTIRKDGAVRFTPLSNFVYIGKGEMPTFPLQSTISPNQLSELLSEFEKIRFNSLSRRYGSVKYKPSANCPLVATDASTVELTLIRDGKRKAVSHYRGCRGAQILDELTFLEDKIDEIANTKQWTSQFGWGTANVVDLKLQVGPGLSKKPDN